MKVKLLIAITILFISGCKKNITQSEGDQIPIESNIPFYVGKIKLTQLPTATQPDLDMLIDLAVTFKRDKNGNWPIIDEKNNEQINSVRIAWTIAGCYSDSTYNERIVPEEVLFGTTNHSILDTLINLTDELTRNYRIVIPSSLFSQYKQTSEVGNMSLSLDLYFNGQKLLENSTENDILYKTEYQSIEHIEYTPVNERIYYISVGTPDSPPFTIIK
ncbi:MAG: hypothetical protein IPH62_04635 [Ignavibacteriae bacterium]|nr:hypothetical protein [Ignavibacteriota bacterium]